MVRRCGCAAWRFSASAKGASFIRDKCSARHWELSLSLRRIVAMSYVFQAVDIFAFDLHVTVNPLADPHLVQKDYGYLVNPDQYREQYGSGKGIETGKFKTPPLTWRSHHKRNDLSPDYIGICTTGKV